MGFLQDIYGAKPKVPEVPRLSLEQEQQKSIAANQNAMPGAEQLVSSANNFSRDQITQMLASVIPGYGQMTNSASNNINSMLSGEIPNDVSQEVQRSTAARALGGGFAGSGMQRNLVARDLGLTSLDLTQKGLSSAESWMKMSSAMYQPSMMNVSSMFINPMQQAAFDVGERNTQTQQQWLENQVSAMPDPVTAGLFKQATSMLNSAMSGAGSAAGGGGGGGGYE